MLLNDAVRLVVSGLDKAGPRRSVADRLEWLGGEMIAVADMAPADFRKLLVERRMEGFSHAIAYYETSLAAHGSKPAWWARDMQALIRACEQGMTGPDILRLVETGAERPVDDETAVLRTYVRWCGRDCCGNGRRCARHQPRRFVLSRRCSPFSPTRRVGPHKPSTAP